jgi:hypothetical protein
LNTPVFISGFSKTSQGISFRSDSHVPTHLVCRLGKGCSIEVAVQAFSHAAFNGRKVLKENEHTQVNAVLRQEDLETVKRYLNLAEELDKRFEAGLGGKAALDTLFPDSANYPSTAIQKLQRGKTSMICK